MIKLVRNIPQIGPVTDDYKRVADLPNWLIYYDIVDAFFQYIPGGHSNLYLYIREGYNKYETR